MHGSSKMMRKTAAVHQPVAGGTIAIAESPCWGEGEDCRFGVCEGKMSTWFIVVGQESR